MKEAPPIRRSSGPGRCALAVGLAVAGLFIFPTAAAYAKTPGDALKAVGYLFLAGYGSMAGGLAGAAVLCGWRAVKTGHATAPVALAVMALGLAAAGAGLFIMNFQRG